MPNDDCIRRSDAVFALCEACEATEICRQIGDPCDEVKRIRAIPAADVEPKRKWIPVTERLPKEDGKYLILHHSQGRPIMEILYYGIPEYLKDRHFYFYDSEWGDIVVGDVTHWLPLSALPELPKGEENDA
jgi:hypothetical protein